MAGENTPQNPKDAPAAFGYVLLGSLAMPALAFLLGWAANVSPIARFDLTVSAAILGVVAAAPMLAFLYWFDTTTIEPFAEFRKSQIGYFSEIGFEFTPLRVILLGIAAGVSEELFFRGFLQVYAEQWIGPVAAIIVTNILFGVLHWRTALYAIIAGGIGAYLGALFYLSGNLFTAIVAHTVYDWIAIGYTAIAIKRYRANAASSG